MMIPFTAPIDESYMDENSNTGRNHVSFTKVLESAAGAIVAAGIVGAFMLYVTVSVIEERFTALYVPLKHDVERIEKQLDTIRNDLYEPRAIVPRDGR